MKLNLRRITLFSTDVVALAAFYETALGLQVVERMKGFIDLDAGGVRLAIHGTAVAKPGKMKLCFFVDDVVAARAVLVERGVKMGKAPAADDALQLCDGHDPDGNVFQLSNRP